MENNKIENILLNLGIEINEWTKDIFKEALTHSSFRNENKNIKDYERLEILGDAIVQKIVTEYLFKKYPNYNESDITIQRKKIVQSKTMIMASEKLNLINHSFLGKGVTFDGNDNIKADLFESFIGAIYLTSGEQMCYKVIEETIIFFFLNNDLEWIDYKSQIQEIFQSNQSGKKNSIFYKSIEENGLFISELFFKNIKYGIGKGKTKKDAEQNAAKDASSKYVLYTQK